MLENDWKEKPAGDCWSSRNSRKADIDQKADVMVRDRYPRKAKPLCLRIFSPLIFEIGSVNVLVNYQILFVF
jgi:hypothetical protein